MFAVNQHNFKKSVDFTCQFSFETNCFVSEFEFSNPHFGMFMSPSTYTNEFRNQSNGKKHSFIGAPESSRAIILQMKVNIGS